MDRRSLTEIANEYGTDKGTAGPSPDWPAHNYADVYEAYLSSMRHRSITLLEIGLGVPGDAWEARIAHGRNISGGASLKMWYDYFPKARIIGIDVNPAQHLDNDRIETYIADQGDVIALNAFLAEIGNTSFDVIVDDGSHRPDHQQISLGCLFPRLKPGGLYFIEDLMRNGKGDGKQGRMAIDTVINTRRLLKAFRNRGAFAQPNALVNHEYLVRHVDTVVFHAPGRRANREGLCAIRKTSRFDHRLTLNQAVRSLTRRRPR